MNDLMSSYPQNVDFKKAIFNPENCFLDEDLKQCKVVRNEKSPRLLIWAGNFAIVFKLTSETRRKSWAVRCFTQEPDESIKQRYQAILSYPSYHQLPYFVSFEFIQEGIKVKDQWYPIVKMEWQEGQTLDDYIEEQINNKSLRELNLLVLKNNLERMKQDLQTSKIAHGDLQHGNILVTPDQKIKLVDYDEMYVPDLKKSPPINEKGHPNYQHPQRSHQDWGVNIDDFSFDVILLSVTVLIKSPDIWERFHHDDNHLIFVEEDFSDPSQSKLFESLQQIDNDEVRNLTQKLIEKCENQDLTLSNVNSIDPIFDIDMELESFESLPNIDHEETNREDNLELEELEFLQFINNEETNKEDNLELIDDSDPFADLFAESEENSTLSDNFNVVTTHPKPLTNSPKKPDLISPKTRKSLPVQPVFFSLVLAIVGITVVFSFPRIRNFLFSDTVEKKENVAPEKVNITVNFVPFLGIRMQAIQFHPESNILKPDLESLKNDLKNNEGVEISDIIPNSLAEKAGLKVNDIIYKINDQLMKNGEDVYEKVTQSSNIGQSVKITIIRNGKKENIRVKLDPYLIPKEKLW